MKKKEEAGDDPRQLVEPRPGIVYMRAGPGCMDREGWRG
jgi:hypothetical protein